MTFVVGDVVQLKCGGPYMVVSKVTPVNIITLWLDGRDVCKLDVDPAMLVAATVTPPLPTSTGVTSTATPVQPPVSPGVVK